MIYLNFIRDRSFRASDNVTYYSRVYRSNYNFVIEQTRLEKNITTNTFRAIGEIVSNRVRARRGKNGEGKKNKFSREHFLWVTFPKRLRVRTHHVYVL